MYSVDTEREARLLRTMCCKLGLDGEYYAPEVVGTDGEDRIEAFLDFGRRLQEAHSRLRTNRKGRS